MPDKQLAAYQEATKFVTSNVSRAVEKKWRTAFSKNGFKQEMLDLLLTAAMPQVGAMQRMVAGLTVNWLSQRTGKKIKELLDEAITPPEELRQEFISQFIQGRKLVKDGVALDEAINRTAVKISRMVATEAEKAKVRQSQNSLIEAGEVRYKRVTHGEESESGVCALCLIASTRVYYVEDLLPIHTNCNCDVDVIKPSDITTIDGTDYVGLDNLQIPEELLEIGPRAQPDSMRTRLKIYLQQLEKKQFEAGLKAWEDTVQVVRHKRQGPLLTYRPVTDAERFLKGPVSTQRLRPAKTTEKEGAALKNDDVVWTGPEVQPPIDWAERVSDQITEDWGSSIQFDDQKHEIRQGAREAQREGYTLSEYDTERIFEMVAMDERILDEPNGARFEGKEIVAKAVHNQATEDYLYRGMPLSPEDAKALQDMGREISLPLSSFANERSTAQAFAAKQHFWQSADVPKGETVPVVLKLEPGARVADLGFADWGDGELDIVEHIAFGRFKVTDVKVPEPGATQIYLQFGVKEGPVPIEITVKQISMLEAVPEYKLTSGSARIPDITILGADKTMMTEMREAVSGIPGIDLRDDLPEALNKFKERWPSINVTGYDDLDVFDTDESMSAAIDVLRGADEVLGQFPGLADEITRIGISPLDDNVAGQMTPEIGRAAYGSNGRGVRHILINEDDILDVAESIRLSEENVLQKFYNQNTEYYPAYSTTVHEMAHGLDVYTGYKARDAVQSALKEAFLEEYPEFVGQRLTGFDGYNPMSWSEGGSLTGHAIMGPTPAEKAYREFLIRELPGDVFTSEPSVYGRAFMDDGEVLAEAFQDVFINGAEASSAHRAVYAQIIKHLPPGAQ